MLRGMGKMLEQLYILTSFKASQAHWFFCCNVTLIGRNFDYEQQG
jgi:hypothetical protein